jgi:hypothetical protein
VKIGLIFHSSGNDFTKYRQHGFVDYLYFPKAMITVNKKGNLCTYKMYIIAYLLLLLVPHISFAQQFKNLNFRAACDTSKTGLCYWDLSWGAKGSVKAADYDKNKVLLIQGKTENSVGFTEQTAIAGRTKATSIITVSAFIKADSIQGKGAGLNIGLYNGEGQLIANKDMGGYYSLDWVRERPVGKNIP